MNGRVQDAASFVQAPREEKRSGRRETKMRPPPTLGRVPRGRPGIPTDATVERAYVAAGHRRLVPPRQAPITWLRFRPTPSLDGIVIPDPSSRRSTIVQDDANRAPEPMCELGWHADTVPRRAIATPRWLARRCLPSTCCVHLGRVGRVPAIDLGRVLNRHAKSLVHLAGRFLEQAK
ncbi:hypothetical protein RJ55_05532 [Drechmeria coniospora]|nr:hypothetical protein RJ55_05532 [Drechmeria coniospora]